MLNQQAFVPAERHKSDHAPLVFEGISNGQHHFSEKTDRDRTRLTTETLCWADQLNSTKNPQSSTSERRLYSGSYMLLHHQAIIKDMVAPSTDRSVAKCRTDDRKVAPVHLFMANSCTQQSDRTQDDLVREYALSELLTLLDIPFLGSLMNYKPTDLRSTNKVYSDVAFKGSVTIMPNKNDPWSSAALQCVGSIPNSGRHILFCLNEHSILTRKLHLYQSIADHYRNLSEPLWSANFVNVHVGLLNLLMQQQEEQALQGFSLALMLLPKALNSEIEKLLRFLHHAMSDVAVSLSSVEDNCSLVQYTFTPALIKCKLLTPHQAEQLVMFMVSKVNRLWEAQTQMEKMLKFPMDKQMKPKTYCSQVSVADFKSQKEQLTETCMVDWMKGILDDNNLTAKDKKQKLKQLKKHHPKIYWTHFSEVS